MLKRYINKSYHKNFFPRIIFICIIVSSLFLTSIASSKLILGSISKSESSTTPSATTNFEEKEQTDLFKIFSRESPQLVQPLLTTQELSPPVVYWQNVSVLDSPYIPVTPSLAVDSNDNLHICWSNYANGRSLYHQIKYANGTWGAKNVIVNYSSGEEIGLNIAADKFGKIHLVYSWGEIYDNQRTFYKVWFNGQWSTSERVDFGLNLQGQFIPAHHPKIAIDSYGTPHVLWSSEVYFQMVDAEFHQVFYQKRLGANSWGPILYVGTARPGNYEMIISQLDVIHVALSIKLGGYYNAYHAVYHLRKRINDFTWLQNDELLFYKMPDYIHKAPNVALVEVGSKIILYSFILNEEFPMIVELRSGGVIWDEPLLVTTNITFGGTSKISAQSINNTDVLLVYTDYPIEVAGFRGSIKYQVYFGEKDEWSYSTKLSQNYTYVYYPYLAKDSKENFYLVWRDNHPISGNALYYCYGILDQDLDGLSNIDENEIYGTNPKLADTDADLLNDGEEISLGLDPLNPDEDSDLILDGWEVNYNFDPHNATDATIDFDFDLLTNLQEFTYSTDPWLNDTDNDLLIDSIEIFTHFTDPNNNDSDFDLLSDGEEILVYSTNALNNDTEGDGMPDGFEVFYSLNPLLDDSAGDNDVDNLTNIQEYTFGTKPNSNDTDTDKLNDYEEIFTYNTNPISPDTDNDILTDFYEVTTDLLDTTYQTANIYQTNPLLSDTDIDGLTDLQELNVTLTNPLLNDTDADLMFDGYECYYGLDPFNDDANNDYDGDTLTNYEESLYYSNPFNQDTDGDRLTDPEEVELGTSLILDDTDGDRITDYIEVVYTYTNPKNADTDYDNLNDYYELVVYASNPFLNDTDGDGLIDGDEVFVYNCSPTLTDTDGDRLLDGEEIAFNSEPSLFDTDGDGMDDYWEWLYGFNPREDESKGDPDNDNLNNYEEYKFFCNPLNSDTDADQINDYQEIYVYLTFPFSNDTDRDSLTDFQELFTYSTSPNDPDCDDDGLTDGEEIIIYHTDPYKYDTDSDGVSDFQEIIDGSDPLNPKSNTSRNLLILLAIIFSSIVGILLLYYILPVIFFATSGSKETTWIRIGISKREARSQNMLQVLKKKDKTTSEENNSPDSPPP